MAGARDRTVHTRRTGTSTHRSSLRGVLVVPDARLGSDSMVMSCSAWRVDTSTISRRTSVACPLPREGAIGHRARRLDRRLRPKGGNHTLRQTVEPPGNVGRLSRSWTSVDLSLKEDRQGPKGWRRSVITTCPGRGRGHRIRGVHRRVAATAQSQGGHRHHHGFVPPVPGSATPEPNRIELDGPRGVASRSGPGVRRRSAQRSHDHAHRTQALSGRDVSRRWR